MTPFLWRILPLIVLGTALCSLANILLTRNMSAAEYGPRSRWRPRRAPRRAG
jgi:hypothetical protein